MLAAGGSIEKGQIGSIIYSAKFPLKHHLLCRGHTIFGKRNNRQFKSIILCLEMKKTFSQKQSRRRIGQQSEHKSLHSLSTWETEPLQG